VRFPGLISAMTVPSGGTSDYAPEMIHAAARGERTRASCGPTRASRSWRCPTASRRCCGSPRRRAIASRDRLQPDRLQPVGRGDPPRCSARFPTRHHLEVDPKRQGIVDSWPEDVDAGAAHRDWGFAPRSTFARAFDEYLIPGIRARYGR
jgi:threonine 3-dehydrogenase